MNGLLLLLAFVSATPADSPLYFRYQFRPGDRLVYRQTLERGIQGKGIDSLIRVEWVNQVVFTADNSNRLDLGIQRNRTRVELVRYRENGSDRLSRERRELETRLAQDPPRFTEGITIDGRGWPFGFWSAVREWTGLLLPGIHEIEPIPAYEIGPGQRWTGGNLGAQLESRPWEDLENGGRCLPVAGTAAGGTVKLRFWLCPADGALRRLEMDGSYPVFGDRMVTERVTLELTERNRNEKTEEWLGREDTRDAVLTAFLHSDHQLPAGPASVTGLYEAADPAVVRQVLALAFRRGWPAPPQIASLAKSSDQRVRSLSTIDWSAPAARSLTPTADAVVASDRSLSATTCDTAPRGEDALRVRRYPIEPPGTTVRPMTSDGYRGFPFVIHVPEIYRGDRPLPLLIFLIGGPGRALQAAQSAIGAVADLGWLVLFPQAHGMWWDEESLKAFPVLLDEILRGFHVDTNRVYLVGMSNGATGGLEYATLWAPRFAGASLLMGAGVLHPDNRRLGLKNLQSLPLLFAHGKRDVVISPESTRQTVAALRRMKRSAPLEIHMLDGREHDLTLGNDQDLSLRFLEKCIRNPFPRRVSFEIEDPRAPRHFWIEVTAKSDGVAEVDGTIGDDNVLTITSKRVSRVRILLRRELLPREGDVRIIVNGKEVYSGSVTEDCQLLARTSVETGDPYLGYSAAMEFDVTH